MIKKLWPAKIVRSGLFGAEVSFWILSSNGYEKPRGAFNDSDVLDLKTVIENNAHIGFN